MLGRRPRHRRPHATRLHPAAIVGICLAATILITLIVGNLLKVFLDDEAYQRLMQGAETEPPQVESPRPSFVRDLNAYPFTLGENAENAIGKTSVSVTVNTPDGTLLYTSEVTSQLNLAASPNIDLQQTLGEISAFVPYVSSVFFPQAFSAQSPNARYAVTLTEAAILREFINAGGSEVLLFGLPLTTESPDDLVAYVNTLRLSLDGAPIGIAIPLTVAADTNSWELLAILADACDFLAVDLTDEICDETDIDMGSGFSPSANAILARCAYLTSQYEARLIFSEQQSALLSTAVFQVRPDFQVIRKPQKTSGAETSDAS